jgi:hypothetical protein
VTHALRTSFEENLRMIEDSVAFLKSKKLEVVYDAEHFFEGYRGNRDYALATLRAAIAGGADVLCLCETNGGMLPGDVREITAAVRAAFPGMMLGVHAHNDSECAVANSLVAVDEGCTMVQGTVNGLGVSFHMGIPNGGFSGMMSSCSMGMDGQATMSNDGHTMTGTYSGSMAGMMSGVMMNQSCGGSMANGHFTLTR